MLNWLVLWTSIIIIRYIDAMFDIANIIPKNDINVRVGENISIQVILNQHHIDNGCIPENIKFYLKGTNLTYLTAIQNESVVNLQIINAQPEDSGFYQIVCDINGYKKAFLGARYVKVLSMPALVYDFYCFSQNWMEMECRWKAPNTGDKHILYYGVFNYPNITERSRCPSDRDIFLKQINLDSHTLKANEEKHNQVVEGSCKFVNRPFGFNDDDIKFFPDWKYYFIMLSYNEIEQRSQYFNITPKDIIKPDPPLVNVTRRDRTIELKLLSATSIFPDTLPLIFSLNLTIPAYPAFWKVWSFRFRPATSGSAFYDMLRDAFNDTKYQQKQPNVVRRKLERIIQQNDVLDANKRHRRLWKNYDIDHTIFANMSSSYEVILADLYKNASKLSLFQVHHLKSPHIDWSEFIMDNKSYEGKLWLNHTTFTVYISDLLPYVQYKVFMLSKPVNKGFYSDPQNFTFDLPEAAPKYIPRTSISAFELTRTYTENNNKLTIYWKSVPSVFQFGTHFYYNVYDEENLVATNLSNNFYAIQVEKYNLKRHFFTITSVNRMGESEQSLPIPFCQKDFLPNPLNVRVVHYSRTQYSLIWSYPRKVDHIGYITVYWCKIHKYIPYTCGPDIEWRRLQLNDSLLTVYTYDTSSTNNANLSPLNNIIASNKKFINISDIRAPYNQQSLAINQDPYLRLAKALKVRYNETQLIVPLSIAAFNLTLDTNFLAGVAFEPPLGPDQSFSSQGIVWGLCVLKYLQEPKPPRLSSQSWTALTSHSIRIDWTKEMCQSEGGPVAYYELTYVPIRYMDNHIDNTIKNSFVEKRGSFVTPLNSNIGGTRLRKIDKSPPILRTENNAFAEPEGYGGNGFKGTPKVLRIHVPIPEPETSSRYATLLKSNKSKSNTKKPKSFREYSHAVSNVAKPLRRSYQTAIRKRLFKEVNNKILVNKSQNGTMTQHYLDALDEDAIRMYSGIMNPDENNENSNNNEIVEDQYPLFAGSDWDNDALQDYKHDGPVQHIKGIPYSNASYAIISGLQPYTTYLVWMRSISLAKSISASSRRIHVTTLQDLPVDPCTNLSISRSSENAIEFVWKPPKIPNGPISHYYITVKYIEPMYAINHTLLPHPLSIKHKHLNHSLYLPYAVIKKRSIAANIAVGNIDNNDYHITHNNNVPSTIKNLENAIIYEEQKFTASQPNFTLKSKQWVGLSHYIMNVSACNMVGCSPTSKPNNFVTPIKAPSMIAMPQYMLLNQTHIMLKWKPPRFQSGQLSHFEILVSKDAKFSSLSDETILTNRTLKPDIKIYKTGNDNYGYDPVLNMYTFNLSIDCTKLFTMLDRVDYYGITDNNNMIKNGYTNITSLQLNTSQTNSPLIKKRQLNVREITTNIINISQSSFFEKFPNNITGVQSPRTKHESPKIFNNYTISEFDVRDLNNFSNYFVAVRAVVKDPNNPHVGLRKGPFSPPKVISNACFQIFSLMKTNALPTIVHARRTYVILGGLVCALLLILMMYFTVFRKRRQLIDWVRSFELKANVPWEEGDYEKFLAQRSMPSFFGHQGTRFEVITDIDAYIAKSKAEAKKRQEMDLLRNDKNVSPDNPLKNLDNELMELPKTMESENKKVLSDNEKVYTINSDAASLTSLESHEAPNYLNYLATPFQDLEMENGANTTQFDHNFYIPLSQRRSSDQSNDSCYPYEQSNNSSKFTFDLYFHPKTPLTQEQLKTVITNKIIQQDKIVKDAKPQSSSRHQPYQNPYNYEYSDYGSCTNPQTLVPKKDSSLNKTEQPKLKNTCNIPEESNLHHYTSDQGTYNCNPYYMDSHGELIKFSNTDTKCNKMSHVTKNTLNIDRKRYDDPSITLDKSDYVDL